jgi:hypothetical protein
MRGGQAPVTTWRVSRDLEDNEGIAWARWVFESYDLSELEWVTARRGAWGGPGTSYAEEAGGWTNVVAGLCRYPTHTRSGMYRINCRVNTRLGWPGYKHQRVSPLYRNADGSWPPVPEGHITGPWLIDPDSGREWKRLYRRVVFHDEAEAFAYIIAHDIAHEFFHYLRRTKQIPGKNAEIDADAFGMENLERFRAGVL